jgi:hypothetical protein
VIFAKPVLKDLKKFVIKIFTKKEYYSLILNVFVAKRARNLIIKAYTNKKEACVFAANVMFLLNH